MQVVRSGSVPCVTCITITVLIPSAVQWTLSPSFISETRSQAFSGSAILTLMCTRSTSEVCYDVDSESGQADVADLQQV